MSQKRLIVFNTAAQVVGKVATVSSTLLITFLITSRLGQVSYGEFTIIMAYAALFYLVVDFGINAIFTQKVSLEEGKLKSYFVNLVSLRVTISLLVIFVALSLLSFSPYSDTLKIGIIISSLTILTQGLFNTANALFQYKLHYHFASIADIVSSISNVLLVYFLVTNGFGVNWIVGSYVISGLVRVFISLFLARRLVGSLSLDVDLGVWKSFTLAALPLGLTAIFSQINGNVDKIILSLVEFDPGLQVSNVVAVGWYGLAYKIFEVLLVLPTFVMNSSFPLMVRKLAVDRGQLKSIFIFLLGSLLGLSVAISSLGFFLAPFIVSFFGANGDSFQGSVTVLRILLLGLPIFYVSALTLWTTIALRQQKKLIYIYGIAALCNVVLNLVFDPIYGIVAAATVTLLTELLVIIPTSIISYRALFLISKDESIKK